MYSENWLHCGQLQYMYHMCMYIVFTVVHCTLCDLIKKLGATHLSYYAATRHSFGLDYGKVILGFVHFK